VAGLPLPNVIVSDSDLTGQPLFPGHGITCQPVTLTTAARTARSAYNILRFAEEFIP
jgi:hypothetical protein